MGPGSGTEVVNKGQIVCLCQHPRGHFLPKKESLWVRSTGVPFPHGPEDAQVSLVHIAIWKPLSECRDWTSLPQLLNWEEGQRKGEMRQSLLRAH